MAEPRAASSSPHSPSQDEVSAFSRNLSKGKAPSSPAPSPPVHKVQGASAQPAPSTGGGVPPLSWHTHVLCAAVFLDLVAVALVIPLLPTRFRELGITPETYGVVASVYSIAQIVGGVAIGFLSDAVLGRRGTLLLSMVGAGVAYYMVAIAQTLPVLIASRVLVGLVKQTMTASTAIMADLTLPGPHRVSGLSRLSAVSRAAWISGSLLGGWLSTFSPRLPAWTAVFVYVVDVALVLVLMPAALPKPGSGSSSPATKRTAVRTAPAIAHTAVQPPEAETVFKEHDIDDDDAGLADTPRLTKKRPRSFTAQLASVVTAFKEPHVRQVLCLTLVFGMVERALRATNDLYLQERFELGIPGMATLRTYIGVMVLFAQTVVIGRLVGRIGQTWSLELAAWLGFISAGIEIAPVGYWGYVAAVVPIATLSLGLSQTCLASMYTAAVPAAQRGSMLGALDVLNSAVGVVAPLVGGLLIGRTGLLGQPTVAALLFGALAVVITFRCFPSSSFLIGAPLQPGSGRIGAPHHTPVSHNIAPPIDTSSNSNSNSNSRSSSSRSSSSRGSSSGGVGGAKTKAKRD